MTRESYEDGVRQLQEGISLSFHAEFYIPSLILLYSAIDIMAWLNRSETHDEVSRGDFKKWVNIYLLPNSNLGCKAIDLYSARCSIVHSYTSESPLSASGQAKKLFYCYGSAKRDRLQDTVDRSSQGGKATVVCMDDLVKAFVVALWRYNEALLHSPTLSALVYRRADKFFGLIPIELINQDGSST
jgi:hypothetical protein